MRLTLQDRYIRYLTEAEEYIVVPTASKVFITLQATMPYGQPNYFMVGKEGSIRSGKTSNIVYSGSAFWVKPAMEQWETERCTGQDELFEDGFTPLKN